MLTYADVRILLLLLQGAAMRRLVEDVSDREGIHRALVSVVRAVYHAANKAMPP